jgi:hypothetical protein
MLQICQTILQFNSQLTPWSKLRDVTGKEKEFNVIATA